jgi:hypothetical protein
VLQQQLSNLNVTKSATSVQCVITLRTAAATAAVVCGSGTCTATDTAHNRMSVTQVAKAASCVQHVITLRAAADFVCGGGTCASYDALYRRQCKVPLFTSCHGVH